MKDNTFTKDEFKSALELAVKASRKSNIDLVRVDVCKYGNELNSLGRR